MNHWPAGLFTIKLEKALGVDKKEWELSMIKAFGQYQPSQGADLARALVRSDQLKKAALLPEKKKQYEELYAKL